MSNRVVVWFVTIAFLLSMTQTTCAQGSMVRRGVQQLIEAIGKKGAKEAGEELVKFGGEVAVRETLELAEKEGGEILLKKVVQYGEKYGVAALAGMKRSPQRFVRSLDELPEEVALKALQAVKREPDLMARLVSEYGTDALRIAAKHPGVGEQITKTLGREGLEIAEHATTQSAFKLLRIAEPIAKLPNSQKSKLLGALKDAPAKLIDFLEKHPKVLLTGAGVVSFIAAKEQILGGCETVTDENGIVRVLPKPGFVERIVKTIADIFFAPLSAIMWIVVMFFLGVGVIKLRGLARVERAKVAIKEAKLAQEASQQKKESGRL